MMPTEFNVSIPSTDIPASVPVPFAAINKGHMMHEVAPEKGRAAHQSLGVDGEETGIEDLPVKIRPGQRIGQQPERPWLCQQRRPPRSLGPGTLGHMAPLVVRGAGQNATPMV
jgi:hypothetical protein